MGDLIYHNINVQSYSLLEIMILFHRTDSVGIVWHSRLYKDAKTPRGGNIFSKEKDQTSDHDLTGEVSTYNSLSVLVVHR